MRKFLVTCSIMLCSCLLFAQQKFTVKIIDAKTGLPVANASATLSTSRKGAFTNTEGLLTIQATLNDVLEITSIGYKPQVVRLSTADITIALEAASLDLGDIVVIGTRGAARAKTETPVPVDVIKINQAGLPTAKMDLTSVLNIAAPSFNYNKQSGADGADHVDLGTLRGLGPDQTLVLINGKRRHQTAFVALFGTRGRGNSGTDLNAFPEGAVDRIEILRDGASAQYGSDAMAGVMNIVLKRDINHWTISTGWSGYNDTKFNASKFNAGNQYISGNKIDGGTVSLSVNNGFAIGKNGGFANISFDLLTQEKTYRQADTTNWQHDKNALPYINSGRRAFGDGSVTTVGGMSNIEIPTVDKKATFYSFGGYNYKMSDAYAYSRNFDAKPERFPVDAGGNLIYDAGIMKTTTDGEVYYNPHIQTHIADVSFAAGIKGKCHNWNWDLSNTAGKNDFHYFGDKTYNASIIGAQLPNHFDDGGFNFIQNTANFDLSRPFKNVAQGLNLGLGTEFRYEYYTIYAGEEKSYASYHTSDIYYPNIADYRTPASGSQGFPGFSPSDVVKASRSNFSGYADAELNVTKEWLVDAAVRFEHYTDFGSVTTYKFATRYKVTPKFNLRGSFSTGFRAPSLQQINFSNTLTSFSGGQLVQSRIPNNNAAITKAAGIPALKQETSVNASFGFSWKPLPGFTFTADGYMIKIKDRVVLSGLFSKDDATLPTSFTSQFPAGVSTVQFFSNAVNTTNYGLDLVADYTKKWGYKSIKVLLAGNIQHMTIDAIHVPATLNTTELNRNTFYSDREKAFLLASAPNAKVSLNLEYDVKKIGVGAHVTYYGKIKLMGFGDSGSPSGDNPNGSGINPQVPTDADPNVYVPEIFNFNGKVVTDVFASYKVSKKVSVFVGADNLFNLHPDLGVNQQAKGYFGDNESGGPWDSVQMGFNGRRLFCKLAFNL